MGRTISGTRKRKLPGLSAEEIRLGCRLGLDSHADVHCVGRHAFVTEVFHGRSCTVYPFNDSYTPMNDVSTVNACFAYDTDQGQTYILEVNQALDFRDSMEHSLLCPNQARIHGVTIEDVPPFLDPSGLSTHSITFPTEDISLPLLMNGPISYLPVRLPTDLELDECQHLQLSCGDSPWDPLSIQALFDSPTTDRRGVHSLSSQFDLDILQDNIAADMCSTVASSAIAHSASKTLEPQDLSRLWNISLDAAKRTIDKTTQLHIRPLRGPLHRRFRTSAHQSRYRQLGGYLSCFASDTFKANVTSTRGNKYTQLFCNRGNFVKAYPMKSKSHAHHSLDRFLHEIGVPTEILTDGAKELTLGNWGKACQKHRIQQRKTEPHSPWQNHAELMGGNLKRKIRHRMRTTNTPVRLWDYCWEYMAGIVSLTASNHAFLDGVTPHEKVLGYSPDISEYLSFSWYQWVWFHDPSAPDRWLLGRWLGPAHNSGQGLASHILSSSGKVVTRSSVTSLPPQDISEDDISRRQSDFTTSVESHIGNYLSGTFDKDLLLDTEDPYASLFDIDDNQFDTDDVDFALDENGHVVSKPDAETFLSHDAPFKEASDEYINLKVPLPHEGVLAEGTVLSRVRNQDGSLKGTANANPILDTREYTVQFGDGSYAEYTANNIVENLYNQVDDDGRTHSMLVSISDHRKTDSAIPKNDGFITLPSGVQKKKITTKGWDFLVDWEDGTSSWIPLADLKESNPLEIADYATAHHLTSEPAFSWWVGPTLRKRSRIVKQVRQRVAKKSLKFGVTVPSSVKEAMALDASNGNSLWSDAISKELKNVLVAFQLIEDGEPLPAGSKQIPYHIIFDVKFDLTRKARLVAGGHRNKGGVPAFATYSSVASRDSVRICLMLAALNDLDVLMADIGNAYLNAPCRERVHVVCGPELFGNEHAGKKAVIVRALYGLTSAGNSWRHHFSTTIRSELGFTSTKADPDVYRRVETRPDGSAYYSYLVVYVDDVLCVHHSPNMVMDRLGTLFRLKDGVSEPSMYLGTDVKKWDYQRNDGTTGQCWALGANSYVKEALKVVAALSAKHSLKHTSSRKNGRLTPFDNHDYRPELDATPLCTDDLVTVYQNLIGIARWLCELGRVDILHEVSILSQYLAQPRIGHLTQSLNIFYYLQHNSRAWMPLDPTSFDVSWTPKGEEVSPQERAIGMKELYPDAVDVLPPDMPKPLGNPVDISVFVDADHAGNRVTRRSHTGILIYCNLAPIIWYSKRQNTVETSTFGSEFIALKIATELTEALVYKLRMFGVPVEAPARVFCDNESVVKNSSYPESTLKKKHVSIAYHRVREAIAAQKMLVYYETTGSNLADLFTKILSHTKRIPIVKAILS